MITTTKDMRDVEQTICDYCGEGYETDTADADVIGQFNFIHANCPKDADGNDNGKLKNSNLDL